MRIYNHNKADSVVAKRTQLLPCISFAILSIYICMNQYMMVFDLLPAYFNRYILYIGIIINIIQIIVNRKIYISRILVSWLLMCICLLFTMDPGISMLRWVFLITLLLLNCNEHKPYSIFLTIIFVFGIVQVIGVYINAFSPSIWSNIYIILGRHLRTGYVGNLVNLMRSDSSYCIGFAYNPGFAATYIVNGLFALILSDNKNSKIEWRIVAVLMCLGVFLTGKRGQFVFLVLSLSAYYLISSVNIKKAASRVIAISIIAISLYYIGFYIWNHNLGTNSTLRILNLIYSANSSVDVSSGRLVMWEQALEEFYKKPIFGIGWFKFQELYGSEPHNTYIQVLCECGIFAFVIFVIAYATMLLESTSNCFRDNTNNSMNKTVLICVIYFVLYSIVENTLLNAETLFMLGYVIILIDMLKPRLWRGEQNKQKCAVG